MRIKPSNFLTGLPVTQVNGSGAIRAGLWPPWGGYHEEPCRWHKSWQVPQNGSSPVLGLVLCESRAGTIRSLAVYPARRQLHGKNAWRAGHPRRPATAKPFTVEAGPSQVCSTKPSWRIRRAGKAPGLRFPPDCSISPSSGQPQPPLPCGHGRGRGP